MVVLANETSFFPQKCCERTYSRIWPQKYFSPIVTRTSNFTMQIFITGFDFIIGTFCCNMTPFQATSAQFIANHKATLSGHASIFNFFTIKKRSMSPLFTKKDILIFRNKVDWAHYHYSFYYNFQKLLFCEWPYDFFFWIGSNR